MQDYRPKPVCKIITKITISPRYVLSHTIYQSQSALVEGQHILYVALVVNEIVDEARRKEKKGAT